MKLIATAFVALALPVVAASGTSQSGLRGVVLIDPASPVCKVGEPCTRPAARVMLVFLRRGRVVARTRTGADGSYRIRLKPGSYGVRPAHPLRPRELTPSRVAVSSGRYRRVVFRLDIGIR